MTEMGRNGPPEKRVVSPKRSPQCFAVTVPKFLMEQPASGRSPCETPQFGRQRHVEPDDEFSTVGYGGSTVAVVVAVDDPSAGVVRRVEDLRLQLCSGRRAPVWTVVKRVQLDVGYVQHSGKARGERGVARAASALDDDSADHAFVYHEGTSLFSSGDCATYAPAAARATGIEADADFGGARPVQPSPITLPD